MTFTETQKLIIETTEPKVLVSSSAASGKTQTLIGRLRHLLDSGVNPSQIVAITFTNNAASVMYERLGKPEGLFIGTVHAYCNYLLRGGAIDTTDIIRQERFDDLFEELQLNLQCVKPIAHLLVDEAQDSTLQQFQFFEVLHPENFMYFFDLRQSIYGFGGACPSYLVDLSKQPGVVTYAMQQNFRNMRDILYFAKKFLYRLGPDYEDDSVAMREDGYFDSFHVLECSSTYEDAARTLVNYKNKLNTKWGDWFVLCRTNAEIDKFRSIFERLGVPTDTFRQADLTSSQIKKRMEQDSIKVLTVHSAKGLENKCVLSYNIRAYDDEHARLCYVAATRAKDFLIWVKVPQKSKRKINRGISMTNWE